MQHGGFAGDSGLGGLLQPSPPSTFPVGGGGDLASIGSEDQLTLKKLFERRNGPGLISGPGLINQPPNFGISPMPIRPGPIFGLRPRYQTLVILNIY